MADEQIIKLLEEIRDLQKAQFEIYQRAIQDQARTQKGSVSRAKLSLLLLAALILALILRLWIPHLG